jgi:hypothetical protein
MWPIVVAAFDEDCAMMYRRVGSALARQGEPIGEKTR